MTPGPLELEPREVLIAYMAVTAMLVHRFALHGTETTSVDVDLRSLAGRLEAYLEGVLDLSRP